ncbi:MAG: hypothetical protein WA003_03420 [Desulfuromonadaceae bacterium]
MKIKQFFLAALTSGLIILCSGSAMALEASDIAIHAFITQGFLLSSDNNYLSANTKDGSFEFSRMGMNFPWSRMTAHWHTAVLQGLGNKREQ